VLYFGRLWTLQTGALTIILFFHGTSPNADLGGLLLASEYVRLNRRH
jgi:hypothetical protein